MADHRNTNTAFQVSPKNGNAPAAVEPPILTVGFIKKRASLTGIPFVMVGVVGYTPLTLYAVAGGPPTQPPLFSLFFAKRG